MGEWEVGGDWLCSLQQVENASHWEMFGSFPNSMCYVHFLYLWISLASPLFVCTFPKPRVASIITWAHQLVYLCHSNTGRASLFVLERILTCSECEDFTWSMHIQVHALLGWQATQQLRAKLPGCESWRYHFLTMCPGSSLPARRYKKSTS